MELSDTSNPSHSTPSQQATSAPPGIGGHHRTILVDDEIVGPAVDGVALYGMGGEQRRVLSDFKQAR